VRSGRALGADREILDGLNAGESVVLSPPSTLMDKDVVDVQGKN